MADQKSWFLPKWQRVQRGPGDRTVFGFGSHSGAQPLPAPVIDDQAKTLVQERPGMLPVTAPLPRRAPPPPRPRAHPPAPPPPRPRAQPTAPAPPPPRRRVSLPPPRRAPRRGRWLVLAVLPVIAVVVLDQRTGTTSTTYVPPPDTAIARRGRLVVKVLETGKVEPGQQARIRSRVGGIVTEVPVTEGQNVRAGEVLIRLDPTDYKREVSRLQADLEERRAQLKLASWRKRSAETGLAEQVVSEAELRAASNDLSLAQARLKASLAALQTAQDQVRYTTIVAPFAGRVIARHVQPGEAVVPGLTATVEGRPLLVLANMRELTVRVDLNQIDFSRVRLGQRARITLDALPGRPFAGRVTSLAASSTTGSTGAEVLPVKVALDPRQDLGAITPGMVADIEIEVARREDALLVPIEAVVSAAGRRLVHVWSAERLDYLPQPVDTGELDDRQIEITGGLADGARVRLAAAAAAPAVKR